MSQATKIEWTQATWNPVTGCTKISPACEHCYAERMTKRLAGRCGYPADEPFRVTLHPDRLSEPLRWRKPRMVFVCSMGDLFHEDVPDEYLDQVFAAMALADRHTFQLLTKRAERMQDYMVTLESNHTILQHWKCDGDTWPLPNVWLGVTAENQEQADKRMPLLLRTPAAVRFVSVEPMLGPVDLSEYLKVHEAWPGHWTENTGEVSRLDWVICGGETGPGARPMRPSWVRNLRDQCLAAQVPFFLKSWGEYRPAEQFGEDVVERVGKKAAGALLDGREWRQMPEVA